MANDVLYNEWASTYDTDGNVLQAVDDLQMHEILPNFLQLVTSTTTGKLNVLDLGCGTGRNTLKLLEFPWTQDIHIDAWDASQGMLDVAKTKCQNVGNGKSNLSLKLVDFSGLGNIPQDSLASFDAIVSTLVLEHLPAKSYFSVVASVLKPGGHALISNMHAGMGSMTRAGYKTSSGERVKGTSYVHTVDGTVQAAKEEGLEVVDFQVRSAQEDSSDRGVREVAVTEDMLKQGAVGARGKKWVDTKIWYGMVLRKQ